MNFLVRHNGLWKEAQYAIAAQSDISSLQEWRKSIGGNNSPIIRDALEFADLACQWRTHYKRTNCLAYSLDEIKEFIQDNPHCQVAVCLVAKASWYKHSPILGMCLFRRTWCHNIFADFLVVHPLATRQGEDRISGVGSGLVRIIARISTEIQAGAMWGEATQNSVGFYRTILGLTETKDLLYVPVDQLTNFVMRMDENEAATRRKVELSTL